MWNAVRFGLPILIALFFAVLKYRQWRDSGDDEARLPVAMAGLFIVLYILGVFLPEGFNWRLNFSVGAYPDWWVPWARYVISPLNLPGIFALTVTAIVARCIQQNRTVLPAALAILSLPTVWTLFLGDVSGLPLAALFILPLGIPIVLLKPQLAAFSLLSEKKWIVASAVWLILSLVIWGLWPLDLLVVRSPEWEALHPQDITLFPWGLLLALPMMWLSRGDQDLLMAAGSFATPHLFPYHFIVLMPSLARMSLPWMLINWLLSWTPLLSNWLGPMAWHFGNLFGFTMWLGIYLNRSTDIMGSLVSSSEP